MEVKVTKSKHHFETVDHYKVAPIGEYEPTVSIDSDNRINIGLIPPADSDQPAVNFIFGRVVSNKLISMIQRLGFHSRGGSV